MSPNAMGRPFAVLMVIVSALALARTALAGDSDLLPLAAGNYWAYDQVRISGFDGSVQGDTTEGPTLVVLPPIRLRTTARDTICSPTIACYGGSGQRYFRLEYGADFGRTLSRDIPDTLYLRSLEDGTVAMAGYSRGDSLHLATAERVWLILDQPLPWEVEPIGREVGFLGFTFHQVGEWTGVQPPIRSLSDIPQDQWRYRDDEQVYSVTASSDRISRLARRFIPQLMPQGPNRLIELMSSGPTADDRSTVHLVTGLGPVRLSGRLSRSGSTHHVLREARINDLPFRRTSTDVQPLNWAQVKTRMHAD